MRSLMTKQPHRQFARTYSCFFGGVNFLGYNLYPIWVSSSKPEREVRANAVTLALTVFEAFA